MGDSAKAIMAQNKPFEETIIEMSQGGLILLKKRMMGLRESWQNIRSKVLI
ncbi:hypothetical protein KKC_15962 [Listeria fleischmannii subsp. coloradonensis]|nr:hypothetical protein KKC_15962 [Listeria fleischmannii subsp. coloradonensis]